MKKNYESLLVILLTIISINLLQGQDLITKRTGEDIKAKILEVGINEIKYKNFDNQNGPTYSLLKNDILIIRYENGTKDLFEQNNSKNKAIIVEEKDQNEKINSNDIINKNEEPKINNSLNSKKIYFGIKGGVNYSSVTGGSSNIDPIIAYHLACFIEFKISKLFSIQPELQYSKQGFKLKAEIRENFYDPANIQYIKFNLNYINLPILAKFNILNELNVVLGPQLSFLTSANNDNPNLIKNSFNGFDYGMIAGIGYNLNNLVLDLRYYYGINQINNFDYSFYENTVSKNKLFQLSIGYKF